MLRQLLQPEALELAARDIVVLRENPGVDDAAPADVVAAIRDRCARRFACATARALMLAAVTSERELHPMAPRARFEVFEVEAEQVVALRSRRGRARATIRTSSSSIARSSISIAAQHALVAGRIAERDRDDAIALARRGRKLEARD